MPHINPHQMHKRKNPLKIALYKSRRYLPHSFVEIHINLEIRNAIKTAGSGQRKTLYGFGYDRRGKVLIVKRIE